MAVVEANSGNILVRNYGNNPAVNFNFMLRVEGVFDLPCKSVRVFQKENEYELIQEGGLNDYVHMRRKPVSKPFTFQVERYVGTDILDPLANGTDLTLPVILMVNRYRIYGDFLPVRMYVFTGCTVMSKEYGELNAEKGGLLVETTTIAYQELACVDNVAGSFLMEEPWRFDGAGKDGNGHQSANRSREEESAIQMKERAKKWMFAGGNSAKEAERLSDRTYLRSGSNAQPDFRGINGSTTDSVYAREEVRKAQMEKKAGRWNFQKEADNGPADEKSAQPDFLGSGGVTTKSAYAQEEIRKSAMEGNAKKWTFGREEGEDGAQPNFLGSNGSTTGSSYARNEARKNAMEENAVKWTFDGGEGSGESSQPNFLGSNGSTTGSTYAQNEVRKGIMEQRAQKWPPKRSAVDTAKFLAAGKKDPEEG